MTESQSDDDLTSIHATRFMQRIAKEEEGFMNDLIETHGGMICRAVVTLAENEDLSLKDASHQFVRKCFLADDLTRKAILEQLTARNPEKSATDAD